MGIYRGPGGTGDAVNDAASEALITVQAKDAALAAQVAAEAAQAAAELAETNAETAETNAETAETNAETAATNAANSASAASTSASNAASSASAASTSASNASTSASNAASSASAASTSASNAASSASTAATQATNASNSASAASTSATNASNSASAAATSATNAANSATAAQTAQTAAELAETNAETAETNAETAATNASNSASAAATSATNASNSASAASTSATNASNSASAAATSATNASNSASAASTSASNAATSESNAASSATAAAASYDSFDDRYLGAKSSAPTLDNDGNALLTGALYFNTSTNEMKVWSGSAWLNAYASLSGALLATNNLSDLNNTATARDNLGVEIGVDVQAYDAQLADIAGLTPTDNNFIVGNGTNFVTESGSTARTSLGLGSIATQDANNVAVTGGSINGTTVGASTAASGAFTSLTSSSTTTLNGTTIPASKTLVVTTDIGSTVQAYDAQLADVAGLTPADNNFIVGNGTNFVTESGSTARTSLGLGSIATQDANNVAVTGGSINGTAIGGTTAAASKFTTLEATGVATFSAGTVSAPAITTTGDTNTGIFFPAADTIAFTEGGVESMRIDSSGNVGIGNASAVGKLEVYQNNNSGVPAIYARQDGTAPIQTWNVAAGAERMRIDSSGNVGIGTSSPVERLQSSRGIAATGANQSVGSLDGFVVDYSSGISRMFASRNGVATGTMAFWTTDSTGTAAERMRIDSSGNVGIGTTTFGVGASTELAINGSSSSAIGFRRGNTLSGYIINNSTAFVIDSVSNLPMLFYTNDTERMRIDSSGNVIVGGTSTSVKFDVQGTGVLASRILNTSTSASQYAIMQVKQGNSSTWQMFVGDNDNKLKFGQSGVGDHLIIDSSGNVGIGTSSPNNFAGYGSLTLNGSTGGILSLNVNGTETGRVQTTSGNFILHATTASAIIRFDTNNTERMRITSSGDLLVGATAAINSAHVIAKNASNNSTIVVSNTSTSGGAYGLQIRYASQDPNNTASSWLECYSASANVLRAEIRSNGGLANYSANNVNLSDEREKTNIQLAGSYLDKICAIPVKTFNYIDQNIEEDDGLTLGVIAQDVQKVAPELVMEGNWGSKETPKMRLSIYQTDLQYALMKCIQEQQAMIEELKQEVAKLKGV